MYLRRSSHKARNKCPQNRSLWPLIHNWTTLSFIGAQPTNSACYCVFSLLIKLGERILRAYWNYKVRHKKAWIFREIINREPRNVSLTAPSEAISPVSLITPCRPKVQLHSSSRQTTVLRNATVPTMVIIAFETTRASTITEILSRLPYDTLWKSHYLVFFPGWEKKDCYDVRRWCAYINLWSV